MASPSSSSFALVPPLSAPVRGRRRRLDPVPHFQADTSRQLDPLLGCPAVQVPAEHLAWKVLDWVALLDTSAVESGYSSLGRRGFHPRHLLGIWLLASLQGLHAASRVAVTCQTDAAFRLVGGGHSPSATILKDFRRNNLEFLQDAVQQTVRIAVERGLVDPEQLAVDAARLQADASTKSARTLKRSRGRLRELAATDVSALADDERVVHEEKVRKHADAVRRCEEEGRTSHSLTDPHAALMKFPNGAAMLGHRVSVTSCGTDLRFVVSALITALPNDCGHLQDCVLAARDALLAAGMPTRDGAPRMQVAADPGYFSEADLVFAEENQNWLDVLISEPTKKKRRTKYFTIEDFHIHDDGSATCPAGVAMEGPFRQEEGRRGWRGEGCSDCALRPLCTPAKRRTLTQNPALERTRSSMRERMAEDGAKARYNKRIATVEPVFSYIEDTMGFRRVSSRKTETVRSEILLKILAYNLSRLGAGAAARLVRVSGVYCDSRFRLLAAWAPSGSTPSETEPGAPRESEMRASGPAASPRSPSGAPAPPTQLVQILFPSIL